MLDVADETFYLRFGAVRKSSIMLIFIRRSLSTLFFQKKVGGRGSLSRPLTRLKGARIDYTHFIYTLFINYPLI
jgi:hypothetical protein